MMGVRSEVLKAGKLDGVVFFNGEFSSSWCARQPDACTIASYMSNRSTHLIIYHVVREGRGSVRVEQNNSSILLRAGGIIIIPHGDAHLMGNGPPVTPTDSAEELRQVLAEGKRVS